MTQKINYQIPVLNEYTGPDKPLRIQGVAINAGVTRNNDNYTPDELQKAAKSLIGKPIQKDHSESIDATVGKIVGASYQDNKILFTGEIMDEECKKKIRDGRVSSVSIGVGYQELLTETKDGENVYTPKGLEFLELSLVAIPGDPNAAISHAIQESLKGEQPMKKIKEQEPTAPPTPAEPPTQEPEGEGEDQSAALKAELEAAKAKIAELESALAAADQSAAELVTAVDQAIEAPSETQPAAAEVTPPTPTETSQPAPVMPENIQRMQKLTAALKNTARPKGRVMEKNTNKIITEGNAKILQENGKNFVVRQGRNGVSFGYED